MIAVYSLQCELLTATLSVRALKDWSTDGRHEHRGAVALLELLVGLDIGLIGLAAAADAEP